LIFIFVNQTKICWIVIGILNLLSETKINYWFKHLLNYNISTILVAIIELINMSREKQISYYLIRYIKQKITKERIIDD